MAKGWRAWEHVTWCAYTHNIAARAVSVLCATRQITFVFQQLCLSECIYTQQTKFPSQTRKVKYARNTMSTTSAGVGGSRLAPSWNMLPSKIYSEDGVAVAFCWEAQLWRVNGNEMRVIAVDAQSHFLMIVYHTKGIATAQPKTNQSHDESNKISTLLHLVPTRVFPGL